MSGGLLGRREQLAHPGAKGNRSYCQLRVSCICQALSAALEKAAYVGNIELLVGKDQPAQMRSCTYAHHVI
jgi:hypothetical protein